jgi:cytochrome c oxidase subunit 3
MATNVLEAPELVKPGRGGAATPPAMPRAGGDGDGRPEGTFDPTRFGLWAFLATVSMLFIGFTSALLLRRASFDWRPLAAPPILPANTTVLLLSSLALESARRRLRGLDLAGSAWLVYATGALGALFVGGQFLAWRELRGQGIYLASNPHSSFFYLLTGIHVLHLAGGLCWYGVIVARLRQMALVPDEDALGLFATYWHFLGLLWLYLLFVLFVL